MQAAGPAATHAADDRGAAPGAPALRLRDPHRPLLGLAAAMGILALVAGVLTIVDPREILGQPAWAKPLKFALSIGIYALTLAWLLDQLRRFRRTGRALGTIAVVGLVVEIVIIAGAAALGTTSHFNVSTPLSIGLWSAMAAAIAVVWLITLLVGVGLSLAPGDDAARTIAIRAGVATGVAGMAVAFLMTSPTEAQLRDFQGVAGAHAVGVADGGPGLPLLGWSTEGGDLRVPHFVGMHALQALPLAALAVELASRRAPLLRDARLRAHLAAVLAGVAAAALAILTAQALAGEPVTAPSAPVLAAAGATAAVAAALATLAVVAARRRAAAR